MTTLRYWAAARAAAGVAEEQVDAATLEAALRTAAERHGQRLAAVLAVCSFLVDGDPVGRRDHASVPLRPGSEVDVLPPYAGG